MPNEPIQINRRMNIQFLYDANFQDQPVELAPICPLKDEGATRTVAAQRRAQMPWHEFLTHATCSAVSHLDTRFPMETDVVFQFQHSEKSTAERRPSVCSAPKS